MQEFFGRMALMYTVQSVRWVLLIKQYIGLDEKYTCVTGNDV